LRVIIELFTVAVMSAIVVLGFPQRPAWLNVLLALCGLGLLLLNRRFTTTVIWRRFPVAYDVRDRLVRSVLTSAVFTLLGLAAMACFAAWRNHSVPPVDRTVLLVLPLYLGWGLLQQYLFQFFLLGRFLVLVPAPLAVGATAAAFALVHAPRPFTACVTLVAGCVWCHLYVRYRVLWPLAVSHALLGAALFHWVYGQNLLARWWPGFGLPEAG